MEEIMTYEVNETESANIPLPTDEANENMGQTSELENQDIINEDGELDVAQLVKTGPRGVTNQGMIPALKQYIKEQSKDKIVVLKNCFPEVVESSLKYLGKKEQKKFNELVS